MQDSNTIVTRFPTPVRKLISGEEADLWIKDDSQTGVLYGGNKVRKLLHILPHARERGARRLVTVGAVGSHHVLGTTLLGRSMDFAVTALLFPQPHQVHAENNLRAALEAGLDPIPIRSLASAPLRLARVLRPGDYLIPAGGSGPIGSKGYYRAASELAAQVDQGQLPEPDVIVVALGSGGTAAGLLAGLGACGLSSLVVGTSVSMGRRPSTALVQGLASWVAKRENLELGWSELSAQFEVDDNFVGRGYGYDFPAAAAARECAADLGLTLDVTYTAKAFAKALELGTLPGYDPGCWPRRQAGDRQVERLARVGRAGRSLRVLYWHTLSGVHPPSTAAGSSELPPKLRKQFLIG